MQCKARSRSGKRCGKHAIAGGTVCRLHGGAAPQVKLSAQKRLALLVDPAIGVMEEALKNKKRPDLAVRAAMDLLDRTGNKTPDKLQLGNMDDNPFNMLVLSDEQLAQLGVLLAICREEAVPGTETPDERKQIIDETNDANVNFEAATFQ